MTGNSSRRKRRGRRVYDDELKGEAVQMLLDGHRRRIGGQESRAQQRQPAVPLEGQAAPPKRRGGGHPGKPRCANWRRTSAASSGSVTS